MYEYDSEDRVIKMIETTVEQEQVYPDSKNPLRVPAYLPVYPSPTIICNSGSSEGV